ncbi:MAG: helix-turn-helix transcriptional regulator [Fimbriimonadaceae bacterium]|nr:helix-turn-helix transcriptional regulator [Fimbriimonadaceae bacterium]
MAARLAREVRDFLAENYRRPVELRQLRDEWHYSETAILRQFRLAWGLTPREFVEAMRLNEARRLLAHTEMSVQDVCLSVGYGSVPSFTRLFRSRYGSTPLAYRAAQQRFWLGWKPDDLSRIPACFLRFGNFG